MSRDWKTLHASALKKLSEDEYGAVANKAYELGQVVTAEELPKQLRAQAGTLFASGKDEAAGWFRKLAEELEKVAKERRDAFREKFGKPLLPR